jgi:hypothetical protein
MGVDLSTLELIFPLARVEDICTGRFYADPEALGQDLSARPCHICKVGGVRSGRGTFPNAFRRLTYFTNVHDLHAPTRQKKKKDLHALCFY